MRAHSTQRWLVAYALRALAFVGVLILLQVAGRTSSMREPQFGLASPIAIDPLPEQITTTRLDLTGTAPAHSVVAFGIGERELTYAYPRRNGRFTTSIEVPPFGSWLWARMVEPADPVQAIVPLPRIEVAFVEAPAIDIATYVTDLQLLWVAGSAPYQRAVMLHLENDEPVFTPVMDGLFEQLMPIDSPPVTLSVSSAEHHAFSPPRLVTLTESDALPIARVTDVQIREQDLSFQFSIELPSGHPLVDVARRRLVTAEDVLRRYLVGPLERLQSAHMSVGLSGGTAVITVRGSVPDTRFAIVPTRGFGALLTPRDRVSVQFPETLRVWFEGTAPAELTATSASWRGPVDAFAVTFGVGGGSADVPGNEAQRVEAPPREREQTRAFLRGLEQRVTEYVAWPLWAIKILIPFAAFVWMLRRAPFAGGGFTGAVVAGAGLLAVIRVWPFIEWLAAETIARLLANPTRDLLWTLGGRDDLPWQTFGTPGWNALSLSIVLIALTGALIIQTGGTVAISAGGDRRIGRIRRLFGRIRAAIAVTAFAGLWLLYQGELLSYPPEIRRPLADVLERFPEAITAAGLDLMNLLEIDVIRGGLFLTPFLVLLLAAGWRAGLLAVGLGVVAMRYALLPQRTRFGGESDVFTLIDPLRNVPLGAAAAGAALLACPLVAWLLERLLPDGTLGRRTRWTTAAALCAAAVSLHSIPVRVSLVLGGALLTAGFLGIAWAMLSRFTAAAQLRALFREQRAAAWGVVAAVTLGIAWPFQPPDSPLRFSFVSDVVRELQPLTMYVLATSLVLAMLERANGNSVILDRSWRLVGVFFFAVILLNSAISWMFIPVPLVIGAAVAWLWLFRSEHEVARLADVMAGGRPEAKQLIRDVLDSKHSIDRFRAVEKSLDAKLAAAELTPTQYVEKVDEFRTHLAPAMELDEVAPGVRSRDIVFALGHGTLRANVASAVTMGAVLMAVPLAIALYQYASPQAEVHYPYPVANVASFLLQAAAQWLLYAFFFGFFFAHLRGASGLVKGINLCAALVIPFFAYRVLSTQDLQDMVPFFLWAAQVFLFCSLIGLLAFDYRLLRQHDFRVRDLVTVHNLPAFSAYASTVVAAVVSGFAALLTNRFTDLARFFIDAIIGGGAAP